MKESKALDALILADFLLGLSSVIADAVFGSSLAAAGTRRWTVSGNLVFGLWLAVCAATVVAWVGLLYRIKPARALYAASWLAYIALVALRGGAGSPLGAVLDLATGLVGGMILALVYFSDLGTQLHALGRAPGGTLSAG